MSVKVEFAGTASDDVHEQGDKIDVRDGHLFVLAETGKVIAIYGPTAWIVATVTS